MRPSLSFLEHCAYDLRVAVLEATTQAGSGHPTSALSCADLVAALFFYAMRFDQHNHKNKNNDRFILSKGHAAPILYAACKELGIISEQELLTLRQFDSVLEGHPTRRFAWAQAATGSLGQGLSIGVGLALSARLAGRKNCIYALMGDGEMAEGSVWEACEVAAHYTLTNLVGIIDCNRLGQSEATLYGDHVEAYARKCAAFGWKTYCIDGHNMEQIVATFDAIRAEQETGRCTQPTMIIAHTIKGYGVAAAEDKNGFHGKAFSKHELPQILTQLQKKFSTAVQYHGTPWQPQLPDADEDSNTVVTALQLPKSLYKKGEMLATRHAYGEALRALGAVMNQVVALDGDVKNSTYAQLFEDAYPSRFFQSFIAEQNMIGMAVGFATDDYIPFAATFGAFCTRAFDQLRMAAVGRVPVRLVGSHAGVSIGQDGPSQMALEDIAMVRTLPRSVIFYPADAPSTYALVQQMASYVDGISYLRTTRMATPIIYSSDEKFVIGGCKVVRQSEHDVACIVAAGITLHEALKAYELLRKQNSAVAVIDLYSVKPFDRATVLSVARKARNRIIVVEDHYHQGGIGEAIAAAVVNENLHVDCLAVSDVPRSGKPEELLAWAGIDAAAIVRAVLR